MENYKGPLYKVDFKQGIEEKWLYEKANDEGMTKTGLLKNIRKTNIGMKNVRMICKIETV